MTVEPASAAGSHTHAGQTYSLLQRALPRAVRRRSGHGFSRRRRSPSGPPTAGRTVHLPDASGDRARRPRRLPDLRHGARAAHRIRSTDAPNPELADMTRRFWVSAVADRAALRARDGGRMLPALREVAAASASGRATSPGSSWRSHRRSCSGAAGRSSCAACDSLVNRSPNMFTLIGLGVGGRLRLQRGGRGRARALSRRVPRPRRRASPSTSSPRP